MLSLVCSDEWYAKVNWDTENQKHAIKMYIWQHSNDFYSQQHKQAEPNIAKKKNTSTAMQQQPNTAKHTDIHTQTNTITQIGCRTWGQTKWHSTLSVTSLFKWWVCTTYKSRVCPWFLSDSQVLNVIRAFCFSRTYKEGQLTWDSWG